MSDIYEITITNQEGEVYAGTQTAEALQQVFIECMR